MTFSIEKEGVWATEAIVIRRVVVSLYAGPSTENEALLQDTGKWMMM